MEILNESELGELWSRLTQILLKVVNPIELYLKLDDEIAKLSNLQQEEYKKFLGREHG